MAIILLSCAVGAILGLAFNVLILPPAVIASAALYCAVFGWSSPGQTIIGLVEVTFALQGGYMIGLTSRDMLANLKSRLLLTPSKRA